MLWSKYQGKSLTSYSVIADETSDTSSKEQMSLVLKFVDKHFDVREEFLASLHCKSGLSGKALSETLLEAIAELKLDINDCRGQGYDGAAAVSGSKNGMAAHIIKENPKAIYTHCFSHRLNLSICISCKIQSGANIMEQLKELSYFFHFSEPRQLDKMHRITCTRCR